ncbi:peptidase S8 and S53, subtilisin, kexin, sedolisin [[Actinomadura] parvosata subsp. kistnae]|uniref:Peptidase S8/S53 domain-containing protein n=1 Tax=[Actinomadura] parvosata subsp. kistnae TaxID=1909395 RepID=A0A1V0A2U2_9ACTN|nr:hypothetical protein BKM31_26285 [Nonomuraea sp. ATCC 55076]SPL89313.1 peptidase S8 and S53, subtilisin, kexin, sedolisin [Actinomadura parvosata subsp. kistnae]
MAVVLVGAIVFASLPAHGESAAVTASGSSASPLNGLSAPPVSGGSALRASGSSASLASGGAAVSEQVAPVTGGVTLISGDRIEVTRHGHRVIPASGREVTFTQQVRGGHLYVIPSDARPLLAAGSLDQRLFDVTQLLQWGYGDAGHADLPLIAEGLDIRGARKIRSLAGLGMTALRVPKAEVAATWRDLTAASARTATGNGGKAGKLWLDGRRAYTLDRSVEQIGATQAWKQGLTGKGVTVAVLDSGYDPDHPDLKDVVTQSRNFTDDPDVRDTLGHGTHVASIVAGAGEKYRGVAPDAKLAIGKVGTEAGPTDSAVLAGMEWAAFEVKAKVVNMSFGSGDTPDLDPLERAVNELSERTGTLFVAGAGNDGTWAPVLSPGSVDAALTVGAVDREGRVAEFSSRGPREGDHAVKPDLTAPGVGIVAARLGGGHIAYDGTSMAAPHVAGAAAILAQRHPDWTGARLKAALVGSARPTPGATPYEQGTGQTDLVRALAQDVTADPANLWVRFPWNDPGDRVATRTLTYANAGATPITLGLAAEGETLRLAASTIEVPAGGTASVTLTIDARGRPTGDHPGMITATAGRTVVRTPAGAFVEPESYDVTVRALDRQGRPVDAAAQLYDAGTGTIRQLMLAGGATKVRLPEGDYRLYADIGQARAGITFAHLPLRVDGADQEVTVDARQAVPVTVTLDDPAATQLRGTAVELSRGPWATSVVTSRTLADGVYVVPARDEALTFRVRTRWTGFYDLVQTHTGGLPDDPAYRIRRQDLQTVTDTYRGAGVAATGTPLSAPGIGASPLLMSWDDVELPGTRTHHRTPGLGWIGGLQVGDSEVTGPNPAGGVWNAAVTGPSAPAGHRTGNEVTFQAGALFADSGGGFGDGGGGGAFRDGGGGFGDSGGGAFRDGGGGFGDGGGAFRDGGGGFGDGGGAFRDGGGGFGDAGGGEVRDGDKGFRDGSEGVRDGGRGWGRSGTDDAATGTATLSSGGRVLAEAGLSACLSAGPCELRAVLPAKAAAYTLSTSMRRQVPYSALSTEVTAEWRFRSASTPERRPLPLMAVRYAPDGLDELSRAERGSVTRMPMWAEGAAVRSVRLEASADDGRTWRPVPVKASGKGWLATVRNPGEPGFVSLRAEATGSSGTTLTQTVIRAYAVK